MTNDRLYKLHPLLLKHVHVFQRKDVQYIDFTPTIKGHSMDLKRQFRNPPGFKKAKFHDTRSY